MSEEQTTVEVIDPAEATAAIAEYSPTEAALAELQERFGGVVWDLTTVKGNADARAARRELVTLRTNLEAKRKALKAPALEYAKRIDSEAKRIAAAIGAVEEPIDAQIKADEARREQERQARAAAAQAVEHATETGDDALDLRREVEARLGLVPSSE